MSEVKIKLGADNSSGMSVATSKKLSFHFASFPGVWSGSVIFQRLYLTIDGKEYLISSIGLFVCLFVSCLASEWPKSLASIICEKLRF